MAQQPIFEYMRDQVVDGALPEGFNLYAYNRAEGEFRFVDGAEDGIAVFHTRPSEFPDDLQDRIGAAFDHVCNESYDAANAILLELTGQYRAVWLVDALQTYAMNHEEDVDPNDVWSYATFLLYCSAEKDLVKVGLILLELFGSVDPRVKAVVRLLALSDEFTLFAAWCARGWENGNDELFRMAQHVKGWGRIHVVEMLEPATEEIRNWLFREGVDNDVLPEYSARTVYLKGNVAARLAGDMDHDGFAAATRIMRALLHEGGPVPGIFALEDPRGELARYVRQAGKQRIDDEARACLEAAKEIATTDGWDDLAQACTALLA
jgi:hypothetical protein